MKSQIAISVDGLVNMSSVSLNVDKLNEYLANGWIYVDSMDGGTGAILVILEKDDTI